MLFRLILIFTLVPIVELMLLIKVGTAIGAINTLLIVLLTGVLGAALARRQGLKTLFRIQESLQQGSVPTEHIIDGFMILAAGLLLITPGILTDVAGFLTLIPATRNVFKKWCGKQFKKMANKDNVHFTHVRRIRYEGDGVVREAEWREER